MSTADAITLREYRSLAEFRYRVRRFLDFSEQAARRHGLEPRQHQALLALKGLPAGQPSTIRHLADRLLLRHHTTVELVGRMVARGLVARRRDPVDRRQILLHLTPAGERKLRSLTVAHRAELRESAPALTRSLAALQRSARAPRTA